MQNSSFPFATLRTLCAFGFAAFVSLHIVSAADMIPAFDALSVALSVSAQ